MKAVSQVVAALLTSGAHTATKIVSPTEVIRATVRKVQGKVPKRCREIVITMGPPNWKTRELIRKLRKAGQSFPVPKIHLRYATPKTRR